MEAGLALAFAQGVVGKFGEIAAEKALNEASLLINFKNNFKWLENQLRQICTSLQVTDEQKEQTKDVKEWLLEVRNIAFNAEDIIDECSVEHLYTSVCNYSQLVFRYKMGKRIKDLKGRMSSAIQEAGELKLFHDVSHLSHPSTSTSESVRGAEQRRWSSLETDAPAVGVDHKVEQILRLLDNPAFLWWVNHSFCSTSSTNQNIGMSGLPGFLFHRLVLLRDCSVT